MARMSFKKGFAVKVGLVVLILMSVYAAWVTAWSRSGEHLEPITLGVTTCFHCGMIVSDLKQAISVLDKDENGHLTTRHFDDVGCFFAFAAEKKANSWKGVAHDFQTGQEIPLEAARFFRSQNTTPMGSGWMAVAGTQRPGALTLSEALMAFRQQKPSVGVVSTQPLSVNH